MKADKKYQLDDADTNRNGRKYVKSLQIINDKWLMSDHKPIVLDVTIDTTITSNDM